MKNHAIFAAVLSALLWLPSVSCQAEASTPAAPQVLVSIKPLELIATAITHGVSRPEKLLPAGASPHSYSLRPSDMRRIQRADLVFWLGKDMEAFLQPVLARLTQGHRALALMEAPGVKIRSFAAHAAHKHAAHSQATGEHEAHEHASHEHDAHEHATHPHEAHDHASGKDPHIWLDPDNAMAIAHAMAKTLSQADPKNAAVYDANATAFDQRVRAADRHNRQLLEPVRQQGIFVFHDAWNYFIDHYQLHVIESFVHNPENHMGARHLAELRDALKSAGKTCVFYEPGTPPNYMQSLVASMKDVNSDVMDPLAENIAPAPEGYPLFMQKLAKTVRDCLDRSSATKAVLEHHEGDIHLTTSQLPGSDTSARHAKTATGQQDEAHSMGHATQGGAQQTAPSPYGSASPRPQSRT